MFQPVANHQSRVSKSRPDIEGKIHTYVPSRERSFFCSENHSNDLPTTAAPAKLHTIIIADGFRTSRRIATRSYSASMPGTYFPKARNIENNAEYISTFSSYVFLPFKVNNKTAMIPTN